MPRPTPIIIPGDSGMGGSWKKSDTNLQLDKIAALFGFIQDRANASKQQQADEAAGMSMLELLGKGQEPNPQYSPTPMEQAPVDTGGGLANMPAPMQPEMLGQDLTPLAKSKEGRDILSSMVNPNKGAEAKNPIRSIRVDGVDHDIMFDSKGRKIADLGLSATPDKTQSYDPKDEVAQYIKKTYGEKALMEWVYSMQIATNTTAGIIKPPSQVMKEIEEKYGKGPKAPKDKPFTPALAGDYLKKYGSRPKAEEAAKKDGYTW